MTETTVTALREKLRSDAILTREEREHIAALLHFGPTMEHAQLTMTRYNAGTAVFAAYGEKDDENATPLSFVAACDHPSHQTWHTVKAALDNETD